MTFGAAEWMGPVTSPRGPLRALQLRRNIAIYVEKVSMMHGPRPGRLFALVPSASRVSKLTCYSMGAELHDHTLMRIEALGIAAACSVCAGVTLHAEDGLRRYESARLRTLGRAASGIGQLGERSLHRTPTALDSGMPLRLASMVKCATTRTTCMLGRSSGTFR